MAAGLPDYFRAVRPKYGGALRKTKLQGVAALAETVFFTITGKGMIYGGTLLLDYTSTQKLSIPRLYIDDDLIANWHFDGLSYYGVNKEHAFPFYSLVYDEVRFIYSVGLTNGFTFDTSFKLAYLEEHNVTPMVQYNIIYALIE